MKVISKKTLEDAQKLVRDTNLNPERNDFAIFERDNDNFNVTIYHGPEVRFLARRIIDKAMRKRVSPYRTPIRSGKRRPVRKFKATSFSMG